MFKKHIFLVFIFLFVFGLYACGERWTASNGKTAETGRTQTPGTEENTSNGEKTNKPDDGEGEIPAPVETGVIAEAVKKLEKEGKYPVLDRSGTLLGTDANNNGIRDDIENYIKSLPLDNNQKSALMQNAYANNMILSPIFDPTSEKEVLKHIQAWDLSRNCTEKYLGFDKALDYSNAIFAFTFNTLPRMKRFMTVNDTAGTIGSWSLPMEEGCDETFFNK